MSKQFVVDDNGHSDHKLAWMNEDGDVCTGKVPSSVSDGSNPITDTEGIPLSTYRVNGQDFCCTEQRQNGLELRNALYQDSPENKALLAHALHKSGLQGQQLVLGVTLPWREVFLNSGKMNRERLKAVADFYQKGELLNLSNGKGYTINACRAYPEGLCAFYDWAIGEDGTLSNVDSSRGPVCVIDIGGSTTDIATVVRDNKLGIDHSRSDTKKIGVLDLKRRVEERLSREIFHLTNNNTGMEGGLPSWMLDDALTTGIAEAGGHTINIKDFVRAAKMEVGQQIIRFVKTTIGNTLGYEKLLFVGGGAIVFDKQIKDVFGGAEFADEFSNARGALKYILKLNRT